MTDELAHCPCGQVPEKLCVQEAGQGSKWAMGGGKPVYDTKADCEKAQAAYHAKKRKKK